MMKNKLLSLWDKHLLPFLRDPLLLSKWVTEYSRPEESGRVSSWVNWGYKTVIGEDEYTGAVFMFCHDMHLKIMPYRFDNSGFKATLTNGDPRLERIIASAIADHDYHHDLSEGVEDFIRNATQIMFHYTEIFYEIDYEKDSDGKLVKLDFHHIYSPSMFKIFGQYFQIITWGAAKHAQIKVGVRKIPKEKILHIKPPKELGGRRGVKKLLKRLIVLSEITPDFYMKAMEKNKNVGFNFDLYIKEKYLEKAIVTKRFGWNQRNPRDNNILEYYSMYRHLIEANSLALIRKHILAQLNIALKAQIGLSAKIEIQNLPTEQTVKDEQQRLKKGDVEFSDIIKRVRY